MDKPLLAAVIATLCTAGGGVLGLVLAMLL